MLCSSFIRMVALFVARRPRDWHVAYESKSDLISFLYGFIKSFASPAIVVNMTSGQEIPGVLSLGQMNSMSPECTHLKQRYDQCFHNWFKLYLEASTESKIKEEQNKRNTDSWRSGRASFFTSSHSNSQNLEALRAQYEKDCGAFFNEYRECIQVRIMVINIQPALKENGLEEAIEKARQENPFLSQKDRRM